MSDPLAYLVAAANAVLETNHLMSFDGTVRAAAALEQLRAALTYVTAVGSAEAVLDKPCYICGYHPGSVICSAAHAAPKCLTASPAAVPEYEPVIVLQQCVVCAAAIRRLDRHEDQEPLTKQTMLHDAGDITITFGYGSKCDATTLLGLICDECAIGFSRRCKAQLTHYSPFSGPERFNAIAGHRPPTSPDES